MTSRLATLLIHALLCLHVTPGSEIEVNSEPEALHEEGNEHFFKGQLKQAIAAWDREIFLEPQRGPHHWQRGLALYYLEAYDKGAAQFISHQKVNGNDVENAAWHFACVARGANDSAKSARRQLIPIEGDGRIPMKEIHRLFSGLGSSAEVLTAAGSNATGQTLRNQLCYAHLYLGLYYEALGEMPKSKEHMKKSAVDFKMDHYMGKVAQLHHQLRNKELETSGESRPPESPPAKD